MRFLCLILCVFVLAACHTPYRGEVVCDGTAKALTDGRYLAIKGTGKATAGIRDERGAWIAPLGAPLQLGPSAYQRAWDLRAKKEIPWDMAALALGWQD